MPIIEGKFPKKEIIGKELTPEGKKIIEDLKAKLSEIDNLHRELESLEEDIDVEMNNLTHDIIDQNDKGASVENISTAKKERILKEKEDSMKELEEKIKEKEIENNQTYEEIKDQTFKKIYSAIIDIFNFETFLFMRPSEEESSLLVETIEEKINHETELEDGGDIPQGIEARINELRAFLQEYNVKPWAKS
jgi:Skp family chaperone for outer membrane proteins